MSMFSKKQKEWIEQNCYVETLEDLRDSEFYSYDLITIRRGTYVLWENFWHEVRESVLKTGEKHPMFNWLAKYNLWARCRHYEVSDYNEKILEYHKERMGR